MSTSKVVLTYKRRRLSAHSDYGEIDAPPSKTLKLGVVTNLDAEETKDAGGHGIDSFSHKNQDSSFHVYSCATVSSEHDSGGLEDKPGPCLPDLNVIELPAPMDTDSFNGQKDCIRSPEEPKSTQVLSGNGTSFVLCSEAGSREFPDASTVNVTVSKHCDHTSDDNANLAGLELHQKGISDAPWITFTRRAKMKKDATKICIKDVLLPVEAKSMPYVEDKDETGLSKNGIFYTRREKLLLASEKDMVANVEEATSSLHLGVLPHTNMGTVDNGLTLHAEPSVENQNTELQLSEHSELVESEKEDNHVKLKLSCTSTSLNGTDPNEVNKGKQHASGNPLGSVPDVKNSHINLQQLVASNPVQNLHSVANDNVMVGGLQWSKLACEPQQLDREGRIFPFTRDVFISNSQDRRFQASDISHAKMDWHSHYDQVHKGQTYNATQFQERMFLPNFPDGRREIPYCSQLLPERPSIFANFLGPSSSHIDPASTSVTNLSCMAKSPGMSKMEGPEYGSRFFFGSLPLTSRTQAVNNILIGARVLNQRQGLGLRKHPNHWSEEELDSLWIGVRRHGRNNWNTILRDPRLYFHNGRTVKELSDRWDIEQSKLFSSVHIPSLNSKPASDLLAENLSECTPSRAETHLSLGNAHFQKLENHMSQNLQFPEIRSSNPTIGPAPWFMDYSKNSLWRKANVRNQMQAQVQRSSIIERSTVGRTTALPHWLKDVVSSPSQGPGEASAPLALDLRRGLLKRNVVCSGTNPTELFVGSEAPAGRKNVFDLNANSLEQGDGNNLVIIESSDASSEETISDDGRL